MCSTYFNTNKEEIFFFNKIRTITFRVAVPYILNFECTDCVTKLHLVHNAEDSKPIHSALPVGLGPVRECQLQGKMTRRRDVTRNALRLRPIDPASGASLSHLRRRGVAVSLASEDSRSQIRY
ncbi:hypothetical protein EVAR_61368_1 [Eumeta japonica]|uniref:Uncharacterized protein n=1 Tax=Eumeta variegata TaxID=151549 RepID=A0A4C1ZA15_EUMVA|nr:hypothetical protein EVAR_61368_1 [Eumeta japonica]